MPEQLVQPDGMLSLAAVSSAGPISIAATENGRFQPRKRVLVPSRGGLGRAKTGEEEDVNRDPLSRTRA